MKTIEEIKDLIAEKHGYEDGVIGSPWDFAMALTYRRKAQIELYEEVINELVKELEFAQEWISINDELPEIKNKRYQIYIKYKSGIDIYDTLAIEPSICTKENLLEILNELNITHWRPTERE